MMKRFVKYILSLSVLLACVYAQSFSVELNNEDTHHSVLDSTSNSISIEDIQNDFPFTELTNTHEGRKVGVHPTAVETEVDDETRELGKTSFTNYPFASNYSAQVVECFLSYIDHTVPTYSYRANFSECWYILFKVFRL